jgi:hypothetical protein
MSKLGQILGVAASASSLALWAVFVFLRPYSDQPLTTQTQAVAAVLAVAAVGGAYASLRRRPYLLLLVFGLSFMPAGLYLLGTPGIFRGIGLANLGWLAAAVLMLVEARQKHEPTDGH